MEQIKETLMSFLIGLGIYAVFVEVIGIFFSEDILSYTFGLLFGIIIAVFLFIHMAKTLDKALDLSQEQASKYVKKQSFLRLFIMLAALVIGLLVDSFNFITIVLGMLGLKIGALTAPVFLKKLYPEHYLTKQMETEDLEG